MNTSEQELIKLVTDKVMEIISNETLVPIGISNRHIHLCQADLDHLFGEGHKLTKLKDLKQPGQFAAEEVVTIKGPKGIIEKVRVLGPVREETQVEVSLSDGFSLGIKPPIKESGDLENSAGIEIVGPKGGVIKYKGAIAALRHIHIPTNIAQLLNIKDKELVDVEIDGPRKAVLGNVLIRVSDKFNLEMHLDTDEANACCVKNGQQVRILKKR